MTLAELKAGVKLKAGSPVRLAILQPTAELRCSSGSAPAAGTAETSLRFGQPLRLTWTATLASHVRLTCAPLPNPPSHLVEGRTTDGGELELPVYINQPMATTVTLYGDDGPHSVWEFHLEPPKESPAVAKKTAGDAIASSELNGAGLELQLDGEGSGKGALLIDPAPAQSARFELIVTPQDGSKELRVSVVAHINNFHAKLHLEDGSLVPAGKHFVLEVGAAHSAHDSNGKTYHDL